jgi:hypothetical protein
MRVKLEQASKATKWEPTQQNRGEGQRIGKSPARERAKSITMMYRFGPPG